MDIKSEISRIETGLRKRSKPIRELCDRAGIDESTWQRWKTGKTGSPRIVTWMRVKSEYRSMTKSKPSSLSG